MLAFPCFQQCRNLVVNSLRNEQEKGTCHHFFSHTSILPFEQSFEQEQQRKYIGRWRSEVGEQFHRRPALLEVAVIITTAYLHLIASPTRFRIANCQKHREPLSSWKSRKQSHRSLPKRRVEREELTKKNAPTTHCVHPLHQSVTTDKLKKFVTKNHNNNK